MTHRRDDGLSKYLWNVDQFLLDYTAQHPTRQSSSMKELTSAVDERSSTCSLPFCPRREPTLLCGQEAVWAHETYGTQWSYWEQQPWFVHLLTCHFTDCQASYTPSRQTNKPTKFLFTLPNRNFPLLGCWLWYHISLFQLLYCTWQLTKTVHGLSEQLIVVCPDKKFPSVTSHKDSSSSSQSFLWTASQVTSIHLPPNSTGRVYFGKLIVVQLRKFLAFYLIRRFTTMFKETCH